MLMVNNQAHNNVLNSWDVIFVAFGAMIGWGWVVSSGQWITTGGVLGTILGFFIGGLMIYYVGLVYAELTTAIPVSGGVQNFTFAAFGPIGAFASTWALLLSYVGVICFEAVSFPTIIQYIFPAFLQGHLYTVMGFDVYLTWLLVAVLTAILIIYINIKGSKFAAKFQMLFTLCIAFVGLLLIIGSIFNGKVDILTSHFFVGDGSYDILSNTLKVAIMTPFFLFGFDVIPQTAEEIKVPLKRLGRIMILSIVMAVVFYALVVLAVGLLLNNEQIAMSMSASGLVTASAMEVAFNSSTMAKVLILGGLCGIITSWNSFLIGGSRILLSMSKSHLIPQTFSKLHPLYKTPIAALLLLGLTSIISVFFGRVMLVWIVNAANFSCCIAYFMVCVSFLFIRKKYPTMVRPYKVHYGGFVGIMAVCMSSLMTLLYLIPGSNCSLDWQEWLIIGGWLALGLFLGIRSKRLYKDDFATGMTLQTQY